MALVKKVPKGGVYPSCTHPCPYSHNDIWSLAGRMRSPMVVSQRTGSSVDGFQWHTLSKELNKNACCPHQDLHHFSSNVTDLVVSRELGPSRLESWKLKQEYWTLNLLRGEHLCETLLINSLPPDTDKIFCSQWLDHRKILFGTKCNKLMCYDSKTRKTCLLPTLPPSDDAEHVEVAGGIHALEANPSQTVLATGATHANDIAFYRLPGMEPISVGHKAHTDSIFDLAWLDEEHVVTCARDSKLALWRVNDPLDSLLLSSGKANIKNVDMTTLKLEYHNALVASPCQNADKLRAVLFNSDSKEIATISLNAYIHVWDPQEFRQKYSRKLPNPYENVCLAMHTSHKMYGVGSKGHLSLIDARTLQTIAKVPTKFSNCGVRSLSFTDTLVTIGTGIGAIFFYDLRTGAYLNTDDTWERPHAVALRTSPGIIPPRARVDEMFANMGYTPAIFTHSYNQSKTQLFAAGGPLPADLKGVYAGIWQ